MNIYNNLYLHKQNKKFKFNFKFFLLTKYFFFKDPQDSHYSKHYPPMVKFWFSSIYKFNKNDNLKLIPIKDKIVHKLIYSYFNSYIKNLKKKSKYFSINLIFISKPLIKHSINKTIITVFTYNTPKTFYLNKIEKNKVFEFEDHNRFKFKFKRKIKNYVLNIHYNRFKFKNIMFTYLQKFRINSNLTKNKLKLINDILVSKYLFLKNIIKFKKNYFNVLYIIKKILNKNFFIVNYLNNCINEILFCHRILQKIYKYNINNRYSLNKAYRIYHFLKFKYYFCNKYIIDKKKSINFEKKLINFNTFCKKENKYIKGDNTLYLNKANILNIFKFFNLYGINSYIFNAFRILQFFQLSNKINNIYDNLKLINKKKDLPQILYILYIENKIIYQKKLLFMLILLLMIIVIRFKTRKKYNLFNIKIYIKYTFYSIIEDLMYNLYVFYKYITLLWLNNFKFKSKSFMGLKYIISTIYNNEIEFKVINLNYIYLDSYILSKAISKKLKNRKIRVLTLIDKVLTKVYMKILDKKIKTKIQIRLKDIIYIKSNFGVIKDLIFKPLNIKNYIFYKLRQKKINGIRIIGSGRLTRRLTASRSITKFRYIGSLRHFDSSYKNIPATMVRNNVKSSLQYTNINTYNRLGSYGIKTFISTN